jgi:hypothetical protein
MNEDTIRIFGLSLVVGALGVLLAISMTTMAHSVNQGDKFADDFESGSLDSDRWPNQQGVGVNSECGSNSGSNSLNIGESSGDPRYAETRSIDTRGVENVSFYLRVPSSSYDCDDPPNDGFLQYSTDGGSNWTTLNTYGETGWTHVHESLPSGAKDTDVKFRWFYDYEYHGGDYNEWAIDDVVIECPSDENDDDICDSVESNPPSDDDNDDVPDSVEREICAREVNQQVFDSTENTGQCTSSTNYDPVRSVSMRVPTNVSNGPDSDDDDMPAYVTVHYTNFTVDREDPSATTSNAGDEQYTLDEHDERPNRPVVSVVCTPLDVPTGFNAPVDEDDDGFPSYVEVTKGEVCGDRRDGSTDVNSDKRVAKQGVDPDDSDPNEPVQSKYKAGNVPSGVDYGEDKDNDTIVDWTAIRYTNITYDRRRPADPHLEHYFDRTSWDPDDDDRSNPVVIFEEDSDEDWIFDAAEEYICLVEDQNRPQDGSCSGPEDYNPPSAYQALVGFLFGNT